MPRKMKQEGNPEVHNDLKGFDIKINSFGSLESNLEVDKLNDFLDEKKEEKSDCDASEE